jgi:hypothetical protein
MRSHRRGARGVRGARGLRGARGVRGPRGARGARGTRGGLVALVALAVLGAAACSQQKSQPAPQQQTPPSSASAGQSTPSTSSASSAMTTHKALATYTPVRLSTNMTALTDKDHETIKLLIEACQAVDEIFWLEAYGGKQALLSGISDPQLRRFAEINYGPWDRLNGDAPFIEGAGTKPLGAGFYPKDVTKAEFEAACAESPARAKELKDIYSVVRRDAGGRLIAVPYHVAFKEQIERAADRLRAASALASDAGFRQYLELRAQALLRDDYQPSDVAWLDMKNNTLDVVIGPIENYEDALMGIRTAHEGFVLVKDREWSKRLARYAQLLPKLQRGLPVPDAYKRETPGSDSDLNAYDAVYFAGDCNAGSKVIAINLPNDEQVQLQHGTRRLQLKNAMQAKFEKIQVPIADVLIALDQRKHILFDAFFANIMFHEVAHGLGIKNTINGKGTVREALKELGGALEEGKADVLGLYIVTRLHDMGELGQTSVMDNYVTYLAGIFRSVRFGASNAHGRANLAQFGYFQKMGAFTRTSGGGYRVDFEKMRTAVDSLSAKILKLQGDGDYDGVMAYLPKAGEMDPTLSADLGRLASADVPVDIVFEQGMDALMAGEKP